MGRERTVFRRLSTVPRFHTRRARLYVPDGAAPAAALARTTHMGVGAHPDDLEIMAFPAIVACRGDGQRWFTGVTCGDGAGSPRGGSFAATADRDMAALRAREQEAAARIGGYGAMVQLGYRRAEMTRRGAARLVDDLQAVLQAARPRVVFTHNPADKHDSHVAVALALVAAIRRLPRARRPRALYGGEVWRDLDWLPDRLQVRFDVSGHERLATALLRAFRSQLDGGKRYDLAVLGRRRGHATYGDPRAVDDGTHVCLAINLTPLLGDDRLDPAAFVLERVDRFRADVAARLNKFSG